MMFCRVKRREEWERGADGCVVAKGRSVFIGERGEDHTHKIGELGEEVRGNEMSF